MPVPLSWIRERARCLVGAILPDRPIVWDDTTPFMSIERDHVISLGGSLFLVRCNEHEGRFGIDDQPKFWVKRALDLATGRMHILKLAFPEEFKIHVGGLEIRCCRRPEKEASVLEFVRGDGRFMQGRTVYDTAGNMIRIVDFISAVNLLVYLRSISLRHEEYFQTLLPGILARVVESLRAIERLHDAGFCHGDIRNDHVLIENGTGCYKWIDFDLAQDSLGFDVWSTGNILHCVAAKGFLTFRDALEARPELAGRLSDGDASVFFPQRVMNLRKVYPYMPAGLNDVLCRFSAGARVPYEKISQVTDDLAACVPPAGAGPHCCQPPPSAW